MGSTKCCTAATRAGRLAKASQFYLAAETLATTIEDQDVADAYVTLCVHAGIAAADAVCCARLGEHAQGDDHQTAATSSRSSASTPGRRRPPSPTPTASSDDLQCRASSNRRKGRGGSEVRGSAGLFHARRRGRRLMASIDVPSNIYFYLSVHPEQR